MKMKTLNILGIVFSIMGIVALAMVDITTYGRLTTGFLGTAVLLLGATIYPSIMDLVKERKKDKQNKGG